MPSTSDRILRIPPLTSLEDLQRRVEAFPEIDTVRFMGLGTDTSYVALYSASAVLGFGGMVVTSSDLNELRLIFPDLRFVHCGG